MPDIRYMTSSVPGFVRFFDALHETIFPEPARQDLIDLAARIEEQQLQQQTPIGSIRSVQSEANHPHWTIAEIVTAAITDYALSNDIAELSHNPNMLFSNDTRKAYRSALSQAQGIKGWLQLHNSRSHLDSDTSLHNSMTQLFNIIRFQSSADHISANFGLAFDDNQKAVLASLLGLVGISEDKTQDLTTALAKPTALSFMNALDEKHSQNRPEAQKALKDFVADYYHGSDDPHTDYANDILTYNGNLRDFLSARVHGQQYSDFTPISKSEPIKHGVYSCILDLVKLAKTNSSIIKNLTVDGDRGIIHIVLCDNHPKWHVDHVDQQVLDIINNIKISAFHLYFMIK